MLAVAIFQLLLVTGALEFAVQALLVVATFLLVSAWVIVVSSTGHRHGTLPRRRFGLLLGASYPVGALIAAAGLLFPSGSAVQLAFAVPGVIIGGFGWLALPVWPLVLARWVFNKPHHTSPTRKEPHRIRRPGRDHPDRLPNVTVIHHDTGEVLSEHATQTAATGATNTNNLADGQSQYER